MLGGVNFRLADVVGDAVKEIANAREQIVLVARVNHHLNAVAVRTEAGAHNGRVGKHMRREQAALPSDFIAVKAREIADTHVLPEFFVCIRL